MQIKKFRGAVFDMDGVLVDSEKLYLRFWQEACAIAGFDMNCEQALSLRSNSPETAIPKFLAWFGPNADYHTIRDLRRTMMADYIDKYGVDMKDGAAEILSYLKEKGCKIALATASPVKRAKYYLEPYGLFDKFDAVISGSDVLRSKPAPDIYEYAAEKLGFKPENCMAVEDSPNGARSAISAGCVTVIVPDMDKPEGAILNKVYKVTDSLKDISGLIEKINGEN